MYDQLMHCRVAAERRLISESLGSPVHTAADTIPAAARVIGHTALDPGQPSNTGQMDPKNYCIH